ncbi:hypothetical protein [Sporosarcina highlanderae]|uniref:Uncharacterized protein n=1 Tax=Sporosarcina highlanderae TaxID=3035916 RepID=A0ABT8JS56_9BACL|nr:hypothetical protein [Sporosarcina highlanderae]MDN4607366.1 hypothetical protein [Sporosarcina highlanderae]
MVNYDDFHALATAYFEKREYDRVKTEMNELFEELVDLRGRVNAKRGNGKDVEN